MPAQAQLSVFVWCCMCRAEVAIEICLVGSWHGGLLGTLPITFHPFSQSRRTKLDYARLVHRRFLGPLQSASWFQPEPAFSWSGRGVEPHWSHEQWLSCSPPRTEGEAGPRCSTRQDLIQADLVLAGGAGRGIHSPASVLFPQVPNRLWRTGNWRMREVASSY